jgi:NAD(P)-dependent dehydrogenase (short-subunit alcohol dehydrogenase family)
MKFLPGNKLETCPKMSSPRHTCIIIGVGPFTSLSLARKLASLGWDLALVSRSGAKLASYASEIKAISPQVKIVTRAADAGNEEELKSALTWAKKELGSVEVCVYNAAIVRKFRQPAMTRRAINDCTR